MNEAFCLIHSTERIKGNALKETYEQLYANKLGKPEKNGQIHRTCNLPRLGKAEMENQRATVCMDILNQ